MRAGLTVRQMMVAVGYAAVGAFVLTPITTLVSLGMASWIGVLAFGLVAVPLAWAVLALGTTRPGPQRDRVVAGLLLAAIATVLAGVGWLNWLALRSGRAAGSYGFTDEVSLMLLASWAVAAVMVVGALVLLPVVVPSRCPACGRRRLLRRGRVGKGSGRALRAECLACGTGLVREGRRWAPIRRPMDFEGSA